MSGRRRLAGLVLGLVAAGALACRTAPVQNIASNVPAGLTREQVREAIQSAAALRSWVVREESPNVLLATLDVRGKHSATVAITYDAAHYEVKYRDSYNLGYDGEEIHENYNGWVLKLDKTIRSELVRASRLERGPS